LAGIVGVVDRAKIIDGSKIEPGDVILGLDSNGLHTNDLFARA
jgi:phosphoribosylformylglycinamidine cyclo-ligase